MSIYSNRPPRTRQTSGAYVRAVLDLIGDRDPIDVMERTPEALARSLAETPVGARSLPEAPGKWSVAMVMQHLADTELVWGYRLRRVLTEDNPLLDGFDQDVWARRFGYEEADLDEALALFTSLRRATLRLIRRAGPEDLRRTARHAERGEADLGVLLRHAAGHDLLHLRQVDRIRQAVMDPGQ